MQLEVGQRVKATVKSITSFGVFVAFEKYTGLVHISEVSHEYITDLSRFVSVGDVVDAVILTIQENGKITLSMKQEHSRKEERVKVRELPQFQTNNDKSKEFDELMKAFVRDSQERLATLKRNTEGKRGGRGGRRG